jgi:hypothetical protein
VEVPAKNIAYFRPAHWGPVMPVSAEVTGCFQRILNEVGFPDLAPFSMRNPTTLS